MGALRQLCGADCCRIVHAADVDCLKAFRSCYDFTDDACALKSGLEAAAPETTHMQEDFGKIPIWHDKPVAL